jgi:anion-transporting  ArsA/GET3 family ATPase
VKTTDSQHAAARRIRKVLKDGRLVVCVGPGGVGKTTTAAALGLRGALAGRRTIVLTIDPARRLANSLGLDALTNEPQRIDLPDADNDTGELWAMMLDSEQTFHDLVDELAPDKAALGRAKENNIFRLLSSALHGMQEYMALDKLHDLYTGGRFDLVILDTPPTKNALEFLQTPSRAATFFDERVIKWFLPSQEKPGFFGRVFNPSSIVLTLVSRVLGESFVNDLVEFFGTFHYLQETLQQRGEMIEFILRDKRTHFFVITSADPRRMKEAYFFHEKLGELDQRADMFVINRVIPSFSAEDIAHLDEEEFSSLLADQGVDDADQIRSLRSLLETHYARLARLALRDRDAIATLARRVGEEGVRLVPLLGEDVHDLSHLLKMSDFLTPMSSG